MAAPILLLDFARTRRFDRRLAFARPATAWRSAGPTPLRAVSAGQPRLDSAGLLLEPAAANLVLHGSAFDQTVWSRTNVTVAQAAAPDGSLTAWKVTETAANGAHRLFQRNLVGEGLHTASVYVKAAERSVVRLRINTVDGLATAAVDLADGSLLADSAPGSTATPVGGGWYRLTVSRSITGSDSMVAVLLAADSGPLAGYIGDPACGLYVWGMQLEAGATASSPVTTGGTAATRAADSCSLPLARLPRWSPAAGTLVVEAELPLAPTTPRTLAALTDAGGSNALRLRLPGGTGLQASAVVGGVAGADLTVGAMTPGTRFRAALAWNADGFGGCLDGGAVASGGPGAPGGPADLHLGHAGGGGEHVYGRLGRVTLYPERLSDAALRRLTRA